MPGGETHHETAEEDAFAASNSQAQLHFVQTTQGAAPTYHVPLFLKTDGALDVPALRRAVQVVAERHEALRTRFRATPTGLLQVVEHDFTVDWTSEEVPEDPSDPEGADAIEAWMRGQAQRPFDLHTGPLFRAALADRGTSGFVFSLCFHHAVCDGWSVRVIVDELMQAYRQLSQGAQPKLPEVDFQFGDYALWHNQWLESASAERQLRYWESALSGELPVLALPPDVPAGTRPEGSGATLDWPLPLDAARRLREEARRSSGTPFAAYLAAYQLVLGDLAGLADVLVGTPALNRARPEFRDTVGCFVNMIVVRTDLSAPETFTDLVAQVRTTALRAQDNQEVPLDLVVKRVNPVRRPGVEPLFQAAFTLGDTQVAQVDGVVSFTSVEIGSTTAKFPIFLQVNDHEEAPGAELEYRADLFSPDWAQDFAARYTRVLELAAQDPDRPLADFFTHGRPVATAVGPAQRRTTSYAEPRDDVERVLAQVWAEVLGLPRVGVDDNFFEAGGDSIRVVQIVARAAERQVAFEVKDLLRHQTIRELAAVVARAPDEPTAALEPFALVPAADRALLPASAVDAYPLTALQLGMLYHSGTDAVHALYHDVLTTRLRVPDHSESAWRAAVRRLGERHEVLRTSFEPGRFSEPLQIVHDGVAPSVTFEEAASLDAVAARMRHETRRPFDPLTAPLVRFHVQRLPDGTVQLWTVLHHAVLDGWSERLLFGELLALYLAELGEPVTVAPPPRARYRSFVALERAAADDREQLAFWRERLAGHVVTRVPAAPATGTPDMAVFGDRMPDELGHALTDFAARAKVPLRIVLLAIHLRVLGLLAGEDDVLSGVVYNGRVPEPDGDRVVGLFLNTLPFRVVLGDESWAGLVDAVMAADVEIQSRQRVPLSRVQHEAGGRTLFDVFFNFTHFHNEAGIPGAVEVLEEDGSTPTNFLLGAEFQRDTSTGAVSLTLRHDAARVPEADARRFHGYYFAAARALLADPGARHADADLLSADERADLARWNSTARDFPGPFVLHRLVEEEAGRTPDACALVAEGATLTYAELDGAANHLAHRLVERGARPGDHVAVCLERRAGLVVALLAVLKAGCAYVPLDPEDPPLRLVGQLADVEAHLVLTDADLPGAVAVPQDADLAGHRSADGPAVMVEPDDAAYVIFTSGSTGRPKGVVVGHRAIVNRLRWTQEEFGLSDGDRVLQKTPATFDVSVWEFFWPLICGARLVVARPGGHRDPDYLVEVIAAEGVTVLHFVPSMLRAFVDAGGPRRCPSVRLVISSGETLPRSLHRHFAAGSHAELANLYGPTEAAVDVTSWRCSSDEDDGPVPIGLPIANLRAHVLDRRRRRVPVAVCGELYLGGAGLAHGYYGQPELTAERFPVHTWPDGTTERLYRTGDLVRRRHDGAIEYLGREDGQVKIRGMRVELGEVEAVVAQVPGTKGAAVVLAGERLLAYLVEPVEDLERVRRHVAGQLPRHMVPSAWVPVSELPLTSSGKLDRRALPDPGMRAPAAVTLPQTPTELAVAGIWAEVLGVAEVGVDVPFADVGGHSLAAVRLVARLRFAFGTPLTVADLLGHDTVRTLALLLQDDGAAPSDASSVVRLRRRGDEPAVWLFPPVGGSVFCYRELARLLQPGRPLNAIVSAGLETGHVPHTTVAEQAAHYLEFLDLDSPVHLFGWSYGAVVAHEAACLLHARGKRDVTLTMLDAAFPEQVDPDGATDLLVNEVRGMSGAQEDPTGTPDERLARLAALPGTGLDLRQLHARARVLAVHLAAHSAHRPNYYPGAATYLEGRDGRALDSAAGWRSVVADLRVHDLPGGHYELLTEPCAGRVAAVLDAAVLEGEKRS
ncbi:amino acid adenylation domain-containing protein [Streptomyces anulatus]|uniref:amino acid adenylation domain-containing protein n=1 Tax=Streptomyces anulatus TaxID=1892 RepID=UPI0036B89D9F